MTNNFSSLLWKGFIRSFGVPAVIIGFILSIFFWIYSPSEKISLAIVVPGMALVIIIILALINTSHLAMQQSFHLPKLVAGQSPPVSFTKAEFLGILEPSPMFSHDTFVTFYFNNDSGFEELLGIGRVIHIQQNKLIQVVLLESQKGFDEILTAIKQNNNTILKKIIVKPTVPFPYATESR